MIDLGKHIQQFKSRGISWGLQNMAWDILHPPEPEPDYSDWPEGAIRPMRTPVGLRYALRIYSGGPDWFHLPTGDIHNELNRFIYD